MPKKIQQEEDNITALIAAVARGEEEAFYKLYLLFKDQVYNVSLSYLQNEQDAEDVLQEVFIKIYQSLDTFKHQSSLNTWIYRITINTALDFLRRKKRSSIFNYSPKYQVNIPTFDHPGVLLENKENARILFKVIHTLSANQKTVFILSYIEGLPRQEIADIMQLSLKAIESLLQRAKSNLRNKLEKQFPNRRK